MPLRVGAEEELEGYKQWTESTKRCTEGMAVTVSAEEELERYDSDSMCRRNLKGMTVGSMCKTGT